MKTDPDKFAQLVFSQEYKKRRSKKESEAKDLEHKKRTGEA